MMHCPDCDSDAVIFWDDGYTCCSCGCEFDDPDQHRQKDDEYPVEE